ncbi:MAG: hypothetical protein Q8P49_04175, partial [Candidatus Liptonbacteria bacterium]|nr:hypothetical protein [Candidatus Liptonbacteria bacterium]
TIKHMSSFEESKMKTVDFGVGLLKTWSSGKNPRIKKTETAFYGTRTKNLQESNEVILKEFENFVEQNEKR